MSEVVAQLARYNAVVRPITDAGRFGDYLTTLPTDTHSLCAAIQNLVLHRNWSRAYKIELSSAQKGDAQSRSVVKIIQRLLDRGENSLIEDRDPPNRFAGTCRDYAVLMTAVLRLNQIPARARCGFATYFEAGRYVDHWVCERWDPIRQDWIRVDAQLDKVQSSTLSLDFDPHNVPKDRFLVAGEVWWRCGAGEIRPEDCGIFDISGLWFVRNNVLRDLAALNRIEVLPWDEWGMGLRLGKARPAHEDLVLIDHAAAVSRDPNVSLKTITDLFESPELIIPACVRNWETGRDESVPT